jgi:flagellum-specific ATP synthase
MTRRWAMSTPMRLERSSFAKRLSGYQAAVTLPEQPQVEGRLLRMVGLTLEAEGLRAALGSRCMVINQDSYHPVQVEAEVMGFSGSRVFLMPVGNLAGIAPGARVVPMPDTGRLPMGMSMLGRVLDGAGRALDGKGGMKAEDWVPLDGPTINPLKRDPINQPLDVGIRSINALLTVGRGQRLGLFAGTGVGKSVLLGMMTRFTEADIIVVGLIGERGREVKEFIEQILGEEGLKRSVVVASPADEAPLMRLRAAMYCTRIAEYFRDKGKNVLLLMDSLTRFAQAQREIALAIGEPPATKGYPPSVFAKLPKLVERAGNAEAGGGSITAFYTVLSEGDDQQDPIADAARGVLDGHIVLSRRLAEEGHYPAIDIEASISRVMPQVITPQHLRESQRFKQLWSRYQQTRDLISVGAYVPGGDAQTDLAIALQPQMARYLCQGLDESESLQQSGLQLSALFNPQAGA